MLLPTFQNLAHDLNSLEEHDRLVVERIRQALHDAEAHANAPEGMTSLILTLVERAQLKSRRRLQGDWLARYA